MKETEQRKTRPAPSHARRRPETPPHPAQHPSGCTSPAQTGNRAHPPKGGVTPARRPGPETHVHAASREQERRLVPDRRMTRLEKRGEREVRRETAWQQGIVRVRGGPDLVMLALILILLALGTITVFSSSYPLAISKGYSSDYYIKSQIRFLLLGGTMMTILTFVPIRMYKSWGPITAYVVSGLLLTYTAVFGMAEGEAVRWVKIGPISMQPSELMKISLVLVLAWYAEKYEDRMLDLSRGRESYKWNIFFPCMILGGACGLVLIGKHLSGTIIVGAIGFFMLLVAGCKMSWLLGTAIPAGGLAVTAFLIANPYALKRITTFTDENADKLDELWQTTQSLYAIGSGGLLGVGLGQSRQKYSYLGNAHTDFIFSIWCEEWGFVGAVVLIALYLLFIWRGYVIAVRAPDRFTMLTAFGITTHVGLQAFLNMCVAADIIMNTGITLPFFSYGGSSLVVLMMEMGVLLSISRQSYRKKQDLEQDELRMRTGLD